MTDLHTKYRPHKLENVVGQDAVVASIRGALANKCGHAFLFSGPSGVGKTTLARIIATMVGCEEFNIVEIDAASHSGVDAMRTLTDGLCYLAIGASPCRMVIVDEAHALSKQAWQSLLKSVEEPGPHTYWVFCSTEGGRIPATIRTRCLTYELRRVRSDDLFDLAEHVIAEEPLDISPDVLRILVQAADGSPRRLLTMLAKCSGANRSAVAELVRDTWGEESGAIELARAVVKGASWSEVAAIVARLDAPPESTRHIMSAYLCKVAAGAKTDEQAGRALEMLDAFAEAYSPTAGLAPLLLSLGRCVL